MIYTCENLPYRRMTFVRIGARAMVKFQFPFHCCRVYPKYLNDLNIVFLRKKNYLGHLRLQMKNLTTYDRLTVDIYEPVLHRNP